MDGRRFDGLTRAGGWEGRRSVRGALGATMVLALVAGALAPGAAWAFDGGELPPQPTPVAAGSVASGSAASLPAARADGGVAPTPVAAAGGAAGADAPDAPPPTPGAAGGGGGTAPTPAAGTGGTLTPTPAAGPGQPTPATGDQTPAASGQAVGTETPVAQTPADETPEAEGAPVADEALDIEEVLADETPDAVGGGQVAIPVDQPISTRIYDGLCGQLGGDPAFQLIELGVGEAQATPGAEEVPTGQPSVIPVRASTSIIDATLVDLLSSPFAVDVRLNPTDPATSIACGDVGGEFDPQAARPQLAIGLGEQNGSGSAGIASFTEQEEGRTLVSVFIAPLAGGTGGTTVTVDTADTAEPAATATVTDDSTPESVADAVAATPAVGGTEGTESVVTTEEVRLRAQPSTEAAIVANLAAGVTLEVMDAETQTGWVPVRDPETGRRGYVSADFVENA